MSEMVSAEIPESKGFSGSFINVRLGVALGAVGLLAAIGLLVVLVTGAELWLGAVLAVLALAAAGYAAYLGIFGVIRYGLFTEGYGAAEVAGELHRSRIAWLAGILAQITLGITVILVVVLIVVALL